MVLSLLYETIIMQLEDSQQKKPLPPEVADIYDSKRYDTYLNYISENKQLELIFHGIDLIITIVIVFALPYQWIEAVCQENVYLIFLLTYLLMHILENIVSIPGKYYETFHIQEKYGLNKKSLKEFTKDELLNEGFSWLLVISTYSLLIFIGEHIKLWTNNFTITPQKAMLVTAAIVGILLALIMILLVISYFFIRLKYTFTPMPDSELKAKIIELLSGSKKKVHGIYIYNESKKSTSKNAFLLKLPWHREIGIADNFINENSERELLAVLSHEIGHLKHTKDWMDYIRYGFLAIVILFVWLLISYPYIMLSICQWVRTSYHLEVTNYAVLLNVIGVLLQIAKFLPDIFLNYCSRMHEFEADREAIKNGYGEDLIQTFKQLSRDELININPHPVIEYLEYDHPGIYSRVKAIRVEILKRDSALHTEKCKSLWK